MMSKTEIVKAGQALGLPFETIWPCYLDHKKWCGQCESCKRAKRAFKAAQINVSDYFET
jgi:7-cyano-7-deazaguanine synthase